MKSYFFYLAGFILIFSTNCSSDDDELFKTPNSSNAEKILIRVVEYGNNLPLPGAESRTFTCKLYDDFFGKCIEEVQFSYCVTGSNGTCNLNFPKDNFNGVLIIKDKYWPEHSHEIKSQYILIPEAWVNIGFVTDVDYPSSSEFYFTVSGKNQVYHSYVEQENVSTEKFTLFGNQENKIDWVLRETSNTSSEVLRSGSFTLNPNRFENLTYSLNY